MENGGNLDARVHNLETRFARVEQILPTLATKGDLERFATKDDLEQQGEELRQFFLEHFRLLRGEVRDDMRVLLDAQNRKIDAVVDLAQAAQEVGRAALEEAHQVGERLDHSLIETRAAYTLARAALEEVRALRGAGPRPGPGE